jgi:hypothetical protein
MPTFRRLLVASAATLMVATGCASISPTVTVPPINVPTIPPINVPTIPPINIPTIPPINLPSGGVALPSGLFPGISIPPGSVPCTLVTAAEVSQILGTGVTDTSDDASNCTFITGNFATISVDVDSSTDLSGVKFLMGNTAQDINVGGFPGIAGAAFGVPAVYVQKPSGQLGLLGFLGGDTTDMVNKLQQIAAIAVTRMP